MRQISDRDETVGAPPPPIDTTGNGLPDEGDDDDDSPNLTGEPAWVFHIIMISAAMYMSMLLTDWGSFSVQSVSDGVTSGEVSMWIKISAQ